MVSIILLCIKMLKIYVLHSENKSYNILNVDNLINIAHILVKLSVLIVDMLIEGTLSQNFKLCSSFFFFYVT